MLLFLFLLFSSTLAQTHTFGNFTININSVSTGQVVNSTAGDKCQKIIARNSHVYHASSEKVYQSWQKGSLNTVTSIQIISSTNATLKDFHVSQNQTEVVFITSDTIEGRVLFRLNQTYQIASILRQNQNISANSVAISDTELFVLTQDVSKMKTCLTKVNFSGDVIESANVSLFFKHASMSPDQQRFLVWTGLKTVKIYSTTPLLELHSYSPQTIPIISRVTDQIQFSQDSTLAIIETDDLYPIQVLNLTNYAVVYSVSINDTIHSAHFLDSANTMMIVFGQSSIVIVNLTSNTFYAIPPIVATSYTTDRVNNYIFTCSNNVVEQLEVTFGLEVQSSKQNQSEEFYLALNLSESEQIALEFINNSLALTSNATNMVAAFAASMPVSIYFLSFLNYFTLCSMYILLNFRIPEHTFKYFSLMFQQINQDFLQMFGIDVDIKPLSDQMVHSKRGAHFEVSSDILSSHSVAFLFLMGNIGFIFLLHWIFSFLKKNNPFRQLISREKWNMIYGQVINLMMPLILPWTYLMLEGGVRNFKTKINVAAYLVLYFLGIVFPIYYFFQLLEERQNILIRQRNQKRKEKEKEEMLKKEEKQMKQSLTKQIKLSENSLLEGRSCQENSFKMKGNKKLLEERKMLKQIDRKAPPSRFSPFKPTKSEVDFKEKKKPQEVIKDRSTKQKKEERYERLTFSKLISFEIVEQWHICQANFIYPCLVLLSSPKIFLIVVQLYTILGVIIAFKRQTMRVNSTILSLYPLLFHGCFMVFYWSSSINVIIITELICLGVYFMGVIHHLLTLLYEIITFLIKFVKNFVKIKNRNSITPIAKKTDENAKEQFNDNKKPTIKQKRRKGKTRPAQNFEKQFVSEQLRNTPEISGSQSIVEKKVKRQLRQKPRKNLVVRYNLG